MAPRDVAVPIAYPDYLIAVDTPKIEVNLPHFPRSVDLFPHAIVIKGTHNKLPHLGHSGIFFFSGTTGTSKYYEYGRYDVAQLGLTRRVAAPDVVIDTATGRPTKQSFLKCLTQLSNTTGQHGRIEGAYLELPQGKFDDMLRYCQKRVDQNGDPKRQPYSLTSHSCVTFTKEVLDAAGVSAPAMIDPRPIGYIEKLQESFPALAFKNNSFSIAGITLPDAKPLLHPAGAHQHGKTLGTPHSRGH